MADVRYFSYEEGLLSTPLLEIVEKVIDNLNVVLSKDDIIEFHLFDNIIKQYTGLAFRRRRPNVVQLGLFPLDRRRKSVSVVWPFWKKEPLLVMFGIIDAKGQAVITEVWHFKPGDSFTSIKDVDFFIEIAADKKRLDVIEKALMRAKMLP